MTITNNTAIEKLSSVMDKIVAENGIDNVINHYDAIYCESLRSEPKALKDMFSADEDLNEAIDEIIEDRITLMFEHDNAHAFENKPSYNDEDAFEDWFYHIDSLRECWEDENQHMRDIKIDENTLVCYICNYKGEGESIALYDDVKNLRIFKSKFDSFNNF